MQQCLSKMMRQLFREQMRCITSIPEAASTTQFDLAVPPVMVHLDRRFSRRKIFFFWIRMKRTWSFFVWRSFALSFRTEYELTISAFGTAVHQMNFICNSVVRYRSTLALSFSFRFCSSFRSTWCSFDLPCCPPIAQWIPQCIRLAVLPSFLTKREHLSRLVPFPRGRRFSRQLVVWHYIFVWSIKIVRFYLIDSLAPFRVQVALWNICRIFVNNWVPQ